MLFDMLVQEDWNFGSGLVDIGLIKE